MDRRELFQRLSRPENKANLIDNQSLTLGSLLPFTGSFDYSAARHLLHRCNFGASHEKIKKAVEDGLASTLEQILTNFTPANLPLNPSYADDPLVPIGETWVDQPHADNGDVFAILYRVYSLTSWTYELLMKDTISIQEKMTLFWHNHFAIHDINDGRFGYAYSSTLRSHSLGNFRDLVKAITIDPMMLRFLNGRQNQATAPNENYARELLELFTIGKGDLAGPGDYTHYTEEDIQEMARVLTGWVDIGFQAKDATLPGVVFLPGRHDNEVKTLSNRFNNATINPAGELEYSNLIDLIFQQEEVAKFICRKIYRWFINFEITEEVEAEIISPLAELLREEDYEIKPVLQELFCSEHFFSEAARGCMIKNPFDFAIGLNNTFEVELSDDLTARYSQLNVKAGFQGLFQMKYFDPPSVAGWTPYYQSPTFYQIWLNSVTLPYRMRYGLYIANGGISIFDSEPYFIDPLKLTNKFDYAQDVFQLVDQYILLLFPNPITTEQRDYLIDTLLDTLPPDEWTIEYSAYIVDQDNEDVAAPIRKRLQKLIGTMLTMAEFQLM